MASCVQCGNWIPDSQKVCSMCYGEVGYGSDGYYEQWLQEQIEQEERDRQELEDEIAKHAAGHRDVSIW